jgi:signal transduction histidine kinase
MAENRLAMIDIFPEAIIIASGRGAITQSNAAARELFKINGIKAVTFADLVIDPPEKINRALQLWSSSRQFCQWLFGCAPVKISSLCAVMGRSYNLPCKIVQLPCLCGAFRGTKRLQLDYLVKLNTEIEALLKHLAEQKAHETERLNNLATAAAVFAHEVANPLNAISTSLQCLQFDLRGRQDISPEILNSLNEASGEIERLSLLLRDFRNFARPQFISLEPTDISTIVRELVRLELLAFRAAGGSITVELQAMPLVMADPMKIKQAILNVCKNAVEAMPHGGSLSIRGYPIYSNKAIALEISDTGCGISEGLDIFGLFKTTKPNGSGLGLPIVEQILSAHNGSISYVSKPGEGTTLSFCCQLCASKLNGFQPGEPLTSSLPKP